MVLAVVFVIISISCIVGAFCFNCKNSQFIGASTTFATLAGAILVFSTLDIQRKALKEEIDKNELSRFDSRFYPILSSFRMDAANMENTLERIKEKGKLCGIPFSSSFFGDKAFFINRKIFETLYDNIKKDSFEEYNAEDIRIELDEIDKKMDSLLDNWASEEDIDKMEKEKSQYLHSQQGGYLMYKYGITKDVWKQYKEVDIHTLKSILLERLLKYQPTILSKYIQSLRFILHIIDNLSIEIDKKDYYLNISSQLGKEELLFLKTFKEFDLITNTESIWKKERR